MDKCLELWTELNNRLPDNGKNGLLIQGNWSCWDKGIHKFGCNGMDCWVVVNDIIDKYNPKNILEIGFNAGHSTCMWFSKSKIVNITSVDISTSESTKVGVDFIKEKFSDRFNFINCNSRDLFKIIKNHNFDLVVVDGDHNEDGCYSDILLTKKLKCKYFLVDDIVMLKEIRNAVNRISNKYKIKLLSRWNVAWGVELYEFIDEPQHTKSTKSTKSEYIFYPKLDSPNYDICRFENKSVEELKEFCDKYSHCAGFNTNGWIKYLISSPELFSHIPEMSDSEGIYVKKSFNNS